MGPDYSRQSASRVHNFNPYKVAMSPAQPTVGPLYEQISKQSFQVQPHGRLS
ncbi:hypothetical protein H9Q72_014218, partial [Fusarium xylarioides]